MQWEDIVDKILATVRTRQQITANEERESAKESRQEDRVEDPHPTLLESNSATDEQGDMLPFTKMEPWTYPPGTKIPDAYPDEEWKGQTQLLISVDPKICKEFTEGYETDNFFAPRYIEVQPNEKTVILVTHFQRGQDNLLYFVDASWKMWLCVPKLKINYVLRWIHESPYESAHAGPRCFLA